MGTKAGARVVVRMTDGSQWVGVVARRPWWRALAAWRTLELERVEAVTDAGTPQAIDGVLLLARRYAVTVQVVS